MYHVLSRGNERRDIFHDDRDRQTFLDVIREMSDQYRVDIFAYTLMDNHYHILLRTNHANLSKSMQSAILILTHKISPQPFIASSFEQVTHRA